MITAARAGDLRAWVGVTRWHQETIFRSAWIAARDPNLAEEITQRTFIRAYRSLSSLEQGAAVRPWLIGIATTVARTQLRELALRRDSKMVETVACPRLPASPLRVAGLPPTTRFEHDVLVNAFDRSNDRDRLVITSRYAFQLDRASAAARLAIPADQLEGQLGDAVRRLRDQIAEAIAEPAVTRPSLGPVESRAHGMDRTLSLPDDTLGSLTMAAVLSEMNWTPDVAAVVHDSLVRDAVAYPIGYAGPRGDHGATSGSPSDLEATLTMAQAPRPAQGTPRRHGWSSPRTTALFIGVALLAFSLVAAAAGPNSGRDVGSRVAGVLGRAVTEPLTTDHGSEGAIGEPEGADMVIAPEPELTASQALGIAIVGTRKLDSGGLAARIRLDWTRPSEFGTVVRTRLERRLGDGAWTTVARADRSGSMRSTLKSRQHYMFRLRSFGASGLPTVSPEVHVELMMRDPGGLTGQARGWVLRPGPFEHRLIATRPDATLSTELEGSHLALLGPTGPGRGTVDVRVDAGPWVERDLGARERAARTILYSGDLGDGVHQVDVRASTNGIALDSMMLLRTTQVGTEIGRQAGSPEVALARSVAPARSEAALAP